MPGKLKHYFQQRARLLQKCRHWFVHHPALEVDTAAISPYANTDVNLDSFAVKGSTLQGYLNTSPEFAIKKLLATEKIGDCFQLARVFRDGEDGINHLAEFTLLEWYRMDWDEFRLMQEVEDLLNHLLAERNPRQAAVYAYRELFARFCDIDTGQAGLQQYLDFCQSIDLHFPQQWLDEQDRDAFMDLILSQYIVPQFKQDRLTFIYHYPASQASLAKCMQTETGRVARRFEVYWGVLELGNGFNELQDAQEQKNRFEQDNRLRQKAGKPTMPVDRELIAALETGLPQCSGVAVGIERLLKVLLQVEDIRSFAVS